MAERFLRPAKAITDRMTERILQFSSRIPFFILFCMPGGQFKLKLNLPSGFVLAVLIVSLLVMGKLAFNQLAKAFMAAWKAACAAVGVVKLQIPAGTYLIGPTKFAGPCKNVHSLTVNMKGYLKGTTDLSQYVTGDWVEFAWVDMLILTGGGTFDGQGAVSWPYNKCPTNKHCKVLPTSVKFVVTSNTLVQNIKSSSST